MKIHFIGIGGIGVSALAQYYLAKGAEVFGSDLVSSEITDLLIKKGAKIKIGKHNAKNIPSNADLFIFSPAVQSNNPELQKARKLKIKTQSYPEALGDLTKKYFTIAVSGAHGKSTTTAMISLILAKAGLDPTVIIGTKLKEFGSTNFREGKSKYLVIEADEWNASFLNYWPRIIALTNIEREHLDYYKDLNHILRIFKEYISHLPEDGVLVINKDDKNINKVINSKIEIKEYSLKQKEAEKLKNILKIPGRHNIYNALAALTVARKLGVSDKVSFKALSEYKGAWRRFELSRAEIRGTKRGLTRKVKLISDYGHHPTEIRATLQATREKFPKSKIWCVFQPHQYQRTFNLFKDFVDVFRKAPVDNVIITDIYSVAGREKSAIKKKVDSQKLVRVINKPSVIFLAQPKIKNYLERNIKNGSVLVIMGAGNIYDLNAELSK